MDDRDRDDGEDRGLLLRVGVDVDLGIERGSDDVSTQRLGWQLG